ncbi:hypothetical protein [uncultured Nostoc sp.]|uniref:hypothetical protein n=1 Tax=uncultured Nostoc sp. TaxID=340711 RepID=UPI00260855C0|nr:hypothetical protein [uncultured Nostoc sp.]
MDSENEINKAIQRLKQVKWFNDSYDYNQETCKLLVREWLRRMALWGKALNATQKWPFISIVDEIFGEREISEPVIIEIFGEQEISESVLAEITVFLRDRVNIYTTIASLWYIRWSGVKNQREVTQFNLPAPYEPLIVFFELGGWLRKEQKFLDGVMIDIDNWKEYDLLKPFICLEQESNF